MPPTPTPSPRPAWHNDVLGDAGLLFAIRAASHVQDRYPRLLDAAMQWSTQDRNSPGADLSS